MKITVTIECTCGQKSTEVAIRHTNSHEGKVFEDYSSIGEGFEENPKFNFHQSHPDGIDITCICGKTHELTL